MAKKKVKRNKEQYAKIEKKENLVELENVAEQVETKHSFYINVAPI